MATDFFRCACVSVLSCYHSAITDFKKHFLLLIKVEVIQIYS